MGVLLEARNLCRIFPHCRAVDNLSLQVGRGSIHAIVGENGAGKSTLLKMLFGILPPSSGQILLRDQVVVWRSPLDAIHSGIGMVHQHFSLVENQTALENVILGAEPLDNWGSVDLAKARELIRAALPAASLDVPWDEKVENLSVGFRQRIELMKALYRNAEIIFLDEPTAVLTPQEVQDFFESLRKLKARGKTFLLVTHKLQEVMDLADTVSVVRRGQLIWTKPIGQTHRDDIVSAMMGRERTPLKDARPVTKQHKFIEVEQLIEVRDARESRRGACHGATLHVNAGEIVGIAGVEGAGQRSLMECLMGLKPYMGQARILNTDCDLIKTYERRAQGVGLIPESRSQEALWLDQSCTENFVVGLEDQFSKMGWLDFKNIRASAEKWAKAFDVRAASLSAPVGTLSGGNQQKLIFARELEGRQPRVLICSQPTRGVDIGAIDLIHQKILDLRSAGAAILLISSELEELFRLSDRIYCLFEGAVSAEFSRSEFQTHAVGLAMTGTKQEAG